jgi:signal transduction histidine kinase/ActR/RegA family two-component response regulator
MSESGPNSESSKNSSAMLLANGVALKLILDRSAASVFFVGTDEKVLFAKGHEAIGFTQEPLEGKRFDQGHIRYPLLVKGIQEALGGQSSACRVSLCPAQCHEYQFESVKDEKGIVVAAVGVGVDVSQTIQTEQQKEEEDRQLRYFQKMESLGLIAGTVAHDFNNYLAAIVSFSESLLQKESFVGRSTIEQIRQTALQAAGVSEQMLSYSGKGMLGDVVREPLELNSLLTEMEPFLRAVSPKSIRLEVESELSKVWVNAKRIEIQQLIMNLLKNATDATENVENGCIMMFVKDRHQSKLPPRRRVGEITPGVSYCAIEIQDNGGGIESEDLTRITEPHFTTKSDGHGFGMAIARRVILEHNGVMEIENVESGGTLIRILLPRTESQPQTEDRFNEVKEEALGGRVVLLVDDEKRVLESVSMLLESKGNKVIAVNSAKKALAAMEESHELIDCLILDYSMPVTNGIELLNRIRAQGWNHPTVLCSGYMIKLDDHPNAQYWPDETLAKPYKFAQLQQAMDTVCRNKVGNAT